MKRIIVDFDGVLHSYTSGWQGVTTIPDPPVPGAIQWLCEMVPHFTIAVLSSRSHDDGGIPAMQDWLMRHAKRFFIEESLGAGTFRVTELWRGMGFAPAHGSSFVVACGDAARSLMERLEWPLVKVPALLQIDDRAFCFEGTFPSVKTITEFVPWNKR